MQVFKTSELYEKLTDFRDNYRKNHTYFAYKRIEPILFQLMNCAFSNTKNPDELPMVFSIHDIMLNGVELKNLLRNIGFDAEVKFIRSNSNMYKSFDFKVTLKKKEC